MPTAQEVNVLCLANVAFHIRVSSKQILSQAAAGTRSWFNKQNPWAGEQRSKEKDSICASFPSFLIKWGVLIQSHIIGKKIDSLLRIFKFWKAKSDLILQW